MEDLLHGESRWLEGPKIEAPTSVTIGNGITSEEEEQQLETLNDWVEKQGLPRGNMVYEYSDPDTGTQKAIFDLAWPNGIQENLTQPVVVLLNEGAETIAFASQAGFRCFSAVDDFHRYVE